MTEQTGTTTQQATKELTLTRILDAPPELVFEAWTNPEHISQWWGPETFTVSSCTSDPRPGGTVTIVMRGPDGTDYPLTGTYRELVAPERVVVEGNALGPDGRPVLDVVNSATFVDVDGKTELTVHVRATALVPEASAMLDGMSAGWNQSLQRLEDFATGADQRQIVLFRMIQAPRDLVFKVFTEREHVQRWWGQRGSSVTIDEMDVRPGGSWRFLMHGPDGVDFPNDLTYQEVDPPSRLSYRQAEPSFRATITFDEFMGMTALSMRMVFETAEARDETEAKYAAVDGGNQTLDRLGEYLASL